MRNEIENRYGHLLDKYLDGSSIGIAEKIQREEEAKIRYGNLLDKAKPDLSIYEHAAALEEENRQRRLRREEERRQADIRIQERIERKRREEKEYRESIDNYVNSIMAKKEAKKEAERKAAEARRKKEEAEQSMLNAVQTVMNIGDEISARVKQTNEMLRYNAEKRKAHEEQMKWFADQKK